MISVYMWNNNRFDSLGDAVIEPTKGTLKQVAGGSYDLSMEAPLDPQGKWRFLEPGNVLKVPVPKEVIDSAFVGVDADIYETNEQAVMRETAEDSESVSYPTWPNHTGTTEEVGMKTSYGGKNYKCVFWDPSSRGAGATPHECSWWEEIVSETSGGAVLATLPSGSELYYVEDAGDGWYKMSTFGGIIGYIKSESLTYVRHVTPEETQPRVITEQLFRITERTVDNDNQKISVTAIHVSYDLSNILIKDVSFTQASPAMAMGKIMDNLMVDYQGVLATNLSSDDNGTYTKDIKGKSGTYGLLDPDNGIVSTFDAKLVRDNWDWFVMEKETQDNGYQIRFGKNMRGVTWKRSNTNLVTRVVPIAKTEEGNDLYLPDPFVDSPKILDYPEIKMERLSVSGQVGKSKSDDDSTTWTEADLFQEMYDKASERFTVDKADEIQEEITIQFEQLGDSEEYRWMKDLESVLLYDTITVIDERIGLSKQVFVKELEWDFIRKKVTGLKLSNVTDYGGKNVTGYTVQYNSITEDKLAAGVVQSIVKTCVGIMPDYAYEDNS